MMPFLSNACISSLPSSVPQMDRYIDDIWVSCHPVFSLFHSERNYAKCIRYNRSIWEWTYGHREICNIALLLLILWGSQ